MTRSTPRHYAAFALALGAVLVVSLALPSGDADAIPAFARKYGFSCTTCHAPFPRLKPYGEEFAARGFRLPPGEEPARATRDTGDPLLQLSRDFPIAARMEGYAVWNADQEKTGAAAETDFETPWVFKALSGGPIAENVSYYVYFIIEKGGVEGLEDAYVQVNGPFGAPFDVLFGQFQVSDPLFKRELRLERSDYEIYKVNPGFSDTDLTYDRGLMFLGTAPGELDVAFSVVNGNGIPDGSFDKDDDKNVALRLSKDFGMLRLGAFGYWGREQVNPGFLTLAEADNEMTYWGPDLTLAPNDDWELNLQYLERSDDNPFFLAAAPIGDVVTRGGFAELHWFPQGPDGRWVLSALYNQVDSDDPAVELETASLTLNYLLARNVRVLTEAGRDLDRDASQISFGLVTAF